MAERVKEQEFETGFLHGWDGSDCIYYTDEKCLYYNDAEAPCHHCHHYTRKTQQKGGNQNGRNDKESIKQNQGSSVHRI